MQVDKRDAKIAQLQQHLQDLLSEERVIKAAVEAIEAHENDSEYYADDFGGGSEHSQKANVLTLILEAAKISILVDEETEEVVHVHVGREHWQFHRTEWEWANASGKWPWEEEERLAELGEQAAMQRDDEAREMWLQSQG